MKATFELPDDLVKELKLFSIHRGMKLKLAVAELLRDALAHASSAKPTKVKASKAMLTRRDQLMKKFLSGEWSAELADYEANEQAAKAESAKLNKMWRD